MSTLNRCCELLEDNKMCNKKIENKNTFKIKILKERCKNLESLIKIFFDFNF